MLVGFRPGVDNKAPWGGVKTGRNRMEERMAKGLLNSCALALVLAQAVWVLPGGVRPASAQALPDNFISSDVPHDVPAGPSATVAQLAVYAWQEFIALNWQAIDPAQTGKRGLPDTSVDFLDIAPTNGSFPLVVWQTYRHKNELFPASGRADSTFDSYMPTYRYRGPSLPTPATGGPVPSFNLQQSRRDERDWPGQHVCPRQPSLKSRVRDTRGLRGEGQPCDFRLRQQHGAGLYQPRLFQR
jgi:hypothetical protein